MHDLIVLGSGIAGLTTALQASRRGLSVMVLTKGELTHAATSYAQGGVAAALAPPDSPDLHMTDTLTAGAGICDVDAVRVLVEEGPDRVRELAALGARFDPQPDPDEGWHLTREGGHSHARVIHAGGDATGAEIERALVDALDRAAVDVREGWFLLDVVVERGRCTGVVLLDPAGAVAEIGGANTVLATGGVGQCFAVTTNPELSTGDGHAAALRAGVACADLEFIQFHPTALAVESMPRPLLSEALRGEGAVLRDDDGVAFMAQEHDLADLASRDIVSRAVHRRLRTAKSGHVWLDATRIPDFESRFPTIYARCREAGLDPTRDFLPVAPAAHYLSGGVVADLDGATTLPGLWACGEVACSGVHGANRLASNSLLDGLVFGRRIVEAIVAGKTEADETGAMVGVREHLAGTHAEPDPVVLAHAGGFDAGSMRRSIQRTMSAQCGVVRDARGLQLAAGTLADLHDMTSDLGEQSAQTYEVVNLVRVARAITDAATAREESRGAHFRSDFPRTEQDLEGRFVVAGRGEPTFVPLHSATVRGAIGRSR